MLNALAATAGNPSSIHAEGRRAREIVETARDRVAALLSVPSKDLVFTSGGSEAIAFAVTGAARRADPRRRRILVSAVEHSAVLESARLLAREGFTVEIVPCEADGRVPASAIETRLADDVALAALQAANPETGVVQPWEKVASVCRGAGVPFLLDAVQGIGKTTLPEGDLRGILVAVSSHKIGGPHGAGALVVPEEVRLAPLVPGGAQERRRRAGTEAVPSLAGFGAAAETVAREGAREAARSRDLRERFERSLHLGIEGVRVYGEGAPRLPNTTLFRVDGIEGETLAVALDLAGFAVSTGSACASGAVEPSHVLLAMGCAPEEARGAVRVSLGWTSDEEAIARLERALPEIVARARRASA